MTKNDEDGFNVTVKLKGDALSQEICGMLRGLLYVNGNSDRQQKKDADFKPGVTIQFGTPPIAAKFMNDVKALFRRGIRKRLHIRQHH